MKSLYLATIYRFYCEHSTTFSLPLPLAQLLLNHMVSGGVRMAQIYSYPSRSSSIMRPSKAPKVLVAERDKLLRLMMAKLLQVSGYKVYTCGDGCQALGLIERETFDLVVTDMMMEGATGIEVLQATRKSQPQAKVIIITGTPSSETLLEAKYEGAYAYLRKPFQLKHFLSVLKDALEHSRLLFRCEYQIETGEGFRKAEY